ncbi:MAG: polysaccharide pyruvyl transferase CsaB [Bacillota bacterium]|nr:polysaccharide pyruvyl transferase CsaB [Bacillota bacterium]
MTAKKYLISGYYGYKNSGDDALLASVVKDIFELNPENRINILSKKGSHYDFEGVQFTDRFDFFKLNKAIRECDILIMGGGSLLQDETSNRSLYYYLGLMYLASLHKKKIYLYANGIGPITKPCNIRLTKKVLNRVFVMTLRDKESYEFVKSIGVDKPRMMVTADSVFSLEPDFKPTKAIENKVAFVIRDWKDSERFSQELAKFADHLIEQHHYKIVFVPLKLGDDERIAERIMGLMEHRAELKSIDNERGLIDYFSTCTFTVCMRFHGLIYSGIGSCIPIGLSYDKKVTSVCKALDLDYLNIEEIRLERLIELSNALILDYDRKKAKLIEHVKAQIERAKNNKEILKSL